jgi:aromatic ring-opening dioxygenase LigB subunit
MKTFNSGGPARDQPSGDLMDADQFCEFVSQVLLATREEATVTLDDDLVHDALCDSLEMLTIMLAILDSLEPPPSVELSAMPDGTTVRDLHLYYLARAQEPLK